MKHLKYLKLVRLLEAYVTEGKITRDSVFVSFVMVLSSSKVKLIHLKRFKDDVKEVAQGYECGITIKNFNDIKEGDIIEALLWKKLNGNDIGLR